MRERPSNSQAMIALIQRVREARVTVGPETIGAIGEGLLVLIGIERGDEPPQVERLLERVTGYRIFPDRQGKMNLSVTDVGGELLLVPQFTLPADTQKGMRPSFTPVASPELAEKRFEHMVALARERGYRPQTGRFGAEMQVHLINEGPTTFTLRVPPA